jgi:hypothetical protein
MTYSPIARVKRVRTTPQTLTGTFALVAESTAQNEDKAVRSRLINQLAIAWTYTANAGATLPKLKIKVQYAISDNEDTPPTAAAEWYTEQIEVSFSVVSSVWESTIWDRNYILAGTPGSAVNFYFPIPVTAMWARVMAMETTSAGGYGTLVASVINWQT